MSFHCRFANHFDQLQNITRVADRSALDTVAQRPDIACLDEKHEFEELLNAINATKKGKASA